MKRIIKAKEEPKAKFFDSKQNIIVTSVIGAVILVIIAVLLFVESGAGKFVVKNNTDLKLEYVNAYFVYSEGKMNEGLKFENIAANQSASLAQEEINLTGSKSNLEVRFKFENHEELFVDAGLFNDIFDGNTKVTFTSSDDGKVIMNVKASNGILPSTSIECKEQFTIDLTNGLVEE